MAGDLSHGAYADGSNLNSNFMLLQLRKDGFVSLEADYVFNAITPPPNNSLDRSDPFCCFGILYCFDCRSRGSRLFAGAGAN